MKENNISPIQSDFEQIKKRDAKGLEYWTSRELCNALGYNIRKIQSYSKQSYHDSQ